MKKVKLYLKTGINAKTGEMIHLEPHMVDATFARTIEKEGKATRVVYTFIHPATKSKTEAEMDEIIWNSIPENKV